MAKGIPKSPRGRDYETGEGIPVPLPPYVSIDFPDYETILFDLNEETNVATVTINRPHAMNSWTQTSLDEFEDMWKRVRYDGRINAVVLRASMEARAFGTGADVKGGDDGTDGIYFNPNTYSEREPGELLGPKANFVWKPVVCAIHGMCAGGALYWVNESDILIASDDAEFFDPHVNGGVVAALEPIGLRHRMPLGEVLRMALMGNAERISAQSAYRYGLISEVVTREELWGRANEIAETIASYNPISVQGTNKAIWESMELGRRAAAEQGMIHTVVGRAKIAATGLTDVKAKRKPPGKNYTLR